MNRSRSEDTKETLSFRAPPELAKDLRMLAALNHTTVSDILLKAATERVSQAKQDPVQWRDAIVDRAAELRAQAGELERLLEE